MFAQTKALATGELSVCASDVIRNAFSQLWNEFLNGFPKDSKSDTRDWCFYWIVFFIKLESYRINAGLFTTFMDVLMRIG